MYDLFFLIRQLEALDKMSPNPPIYSEYGIQMPRWWVGSLKILRQCSIFSRRSSLSHPHTHTPPHTPTQLSCSTVQFINRPLRRGEGGNPGKNRQPLWQRVCHLVIGGTLEECNIKHCHLLGCFTTKRLTARPQRFVRNQPVVQFET